MTDALELCVRVISPDLEWSAWAWGDPTGGWTSPGQDWVSSLAAAGVPFRAGPDASIDDGRGLLLLPDPDAVEVALRPGRPVLTGPPPAGWTQRLEALVQAVGAIALPDLRGVLVLRLDDPGAAVKQHLAGWAHEDVARASWESLWSSLRGGRISVFCCPGWIAADGSVLDSRRVSPAEWAAVADGVRRGHAELECHGYTHMHPDSRRWAGAADRHTNPDWFRELWPPDEPTEPSVDAQFERLRAWQEATGIRGTTVVAPGEAWGVGSVAAARRSGFALFNSWEVCRLEGRVPIWTRGVGSPYLDQAAGEATRDGLPTVGYFHDRDMATEGPGWVPEQLARWRDCGVTQFWSFADLARAYTAPVEAALIGNEVVLRPEPRWPIRIERR